MRCNLYILGTLVFAATLAVSPARAQQPQDQPQDQTQDPITKPEQPTQPIPAIRSPLAGINGDDQDDEVKQKTLPDTTPISGVENISLGKAPLDHNFWQPQFKIFTTVDSDDLSANGNGGWGDFTSFLGGIDLHESSGISNLTLSYVGGATIAIGGTAGNSVVQQMSVNEQLTWRRVRLTFIDQLSLLPEASFGYSGLGGGVALPGGGSLGLQGGLTPGESVLTTRGLRLSNTGLTQADFFLTPRNSITVAGGYSLLHYFDNSLVDFGTAIFQAGVNRQMTRKDTLGFFYRFSGYRYSGFDQSINDNSLQLSYARRVTGRLSFLIGGGPDITFVTAPLTTSSPAPTSSSRMTELYYSFNTNIQYQLERTGFAASYSHGVTGGSGVLEGSIADTAEGTASRQLTRQLAGSFSAGYSHNIGINAFSTTPTPTTQAYSYWFASINFFRTLGRALDVNLNYVVQYQTSNSAFCIGPTCSTSLVRNVINVGVNWHRQPIPF